MGAQVRVERGDEARRKVVLGGAHGDPRRERRERLVTDVLVDDVRRLPEARHVHPGLAVEPAERLGERLARDPVQRERERVDRGRDDVRADARRDERVRERRAARRLDVEADRKPARLPEALDELLRHVRQEAARRVVEEHACRAEVAQLPRLLDERVHLAGPAGAVDEPDVELAAGADDRLAGFAEVRDVVQRVVQAEDVDPVVGRAGDEPPHDVGRDGLRADEEPAAERDAERCRRPGVDRADPLPRALDAAPHGCVEDTAARHLEAGEPGAVEDLGDPEDLAGRDAPGKRLLREQPDGRVEEPRHGGSLLASRNPQERIPAA